jgi:hypothetical protein
MGQAAMTDADEAAWTLAIEMYRARGPHDAEHIDAKLTREGCKEAGKAAAYSMQGRSLHLPPWATVPCYLLDDVDAALARGDDGIRGNYNAAVLLKRMQRHGISRWHPDPIAALREAEKDAAA